MPDGHLLWHIWEYQGQSTLVFREEGYRKKYRKNLITKSIALTTLDAYCKKYKIYPNGLKIDVEGAEAIVIEGAQNIIEKYSPWVLMEFHAIYMDNKKKNWHKIVNSAKKVLFIDGSSQKYQYGERTST